MSSVNKTRKRRTVGIEARKARTGVLFTLPWILGLLIFYAYPLIASIYYSFTSYSVLNPGEFVGLANYKTLMADKLFWKSIANTLIFTAMSVPINIILGVAIALLLNTKIHGIGFYRTIFFIPTLVPVVATANVVMGVINALQIFTLPYALTNGEGSPTHSLTFYVMHLYNNAFGYMKMGYASAMAWILFVIILVLTLVIFGTSKKWVYYQ